MQGYLNLFTAEAITIDRTQSFHSTSYKSASSYTLPHVVKKRNKHPKPAPAAADGNGRLRKSHWRCCPEL